MEIEYTDWQIHNVCEHLRELAVGVSINTSVMRSARDIILQQSKKLTQLEDTIVVLSQPKPEEKVTMIVTKKRKKGDLNITVDTESKIGE